VSAPLPNSRDGWATQRASPGRFYPPEGEKATSPFPGPFPESVEDREKAKHLSSFLRRALPEPMLNRIIRLRRQNRSSLKPRRCAFPRGTSRGHLLQRELPRSRAPKRREFAKEVSVLLLKGTWHRRAQLATSVMPGKLHRGEVSRESC